MQEFDSLNNPEINDFRFKMRRLGDAIAQKRTKYTWQEKLYYQFPPRLCEPPVGLFGSDRQNVKIATKFENNEVLISNFLNFCSNCYV